MAGCIDLLIGIAATSALIGLQRVALSPLGVRTRVDAPRLRWQRLIFTAVAVIASIMTLNAVSPSWGTLGIITTLAVVTLLTMGALGVAGPFIIALIARWRVSTTSDPAALIAARGNLESPKAAWRQVSGVALTSFLLLPAGSMLGFLYAVQNSSTVLTEADMLFFRDARTMLIGLVAIAYLLVACQVGITQASAVLEHRDLYILLDRIGMPLRSMNRARDKHVMTPAIVAILGSATISALLTTPLLLVAIMNAPLFVVGSFALLIAGVLLVKGGVRATAPLLHRVIAQGTPKAD